MSLSALTKPWEAFSYGFLDASAKRELRRKMLKAIAVHLGQPVDFFDGPVDHLMAIPLLSDYVRSVVDVDNVTVVSPDTGRVRVAEQWAERLQAYYSRLEALLWPDLFVVGGGVSKQADSFLPLLDIRTPIVPAKLKNKAGIVGAAYLAARG